MRLVAIMALPILICAGAAVAAPGESPLLAEQPASPYRLSPTGEPTLRFSNKGFDFRVSEIVQPDGSSKRSRGVIAGMEVSKDAVIGIGFFEMTPKKQSIVGPSRLDEPTKRSRKAAVGFTLNF